MAITFITGNPNKALEVSQILGGLPVTAATADVDEIQSMSLREVVERKVRDAQAMVGGAVMVEDVSLEYGALNGFPGPFIKFWYQEVGHDKAVRIADLFGNHDMTARCGAAYFDGTTFLYAEGVAKGRVVPRRGESGFGFDPYFQPEGETRTFAEMSAEEKNAISHRGVAFRGLRDKLIEAGLL